MLNLTLNYNLPFGSRDVTKYNTNELFHIDKYHSSSLYSINLANVGGLMNDSEICERLRNIVIDRFVKFIKYFLKS